MNNKQEIIGVLNKVYSHSEEKFNNVFTPFELTEQMANSLNYDDTKTLLVLVNLEFLIELKIRNISLENIHYSSGCKHKRRFAENLGVNVNNIHSLEYKDKEIKVTHNDMAMKFDYMVGYPPYNPNSLWKKFVLKGIDLLNDNGHMVMIHPDSWRTSSKHKKLFDHLKEHISELHIEGYNIFDNAEISVDWYLYNKNTVDKTKIFYPDGEINEIKITNEISPVCMSSIEYSIKNKICNEDDNGIIIKNANFTPQYKSHVENGIYKQCGGLGNNTGWTKGDFSLTMEPDKHQFENKVVMTYCGKPRATYFNNNIGVIRGFYWITDNKSLPILLNSKMVWKILLIFSGEKYKYKGLQNPSTKILKHLNFNNLNVQTEEELYEHYGLTEEEINFCET